MTQQGRLNKITNYSYRKKHWFDTLKLDWVCIRNYFEYHDDKGRRDYNKQAVFVSAHTHVLQPQQLSFWSLLSVRGLRSLWVAERISGRWG